MRTRRALIRSGATALALVAGCATQGNGTEGSGNGSFAGTRTDGSSPTDATTDRRLPFDAAHEGRIDVEFSSLTVRHSLFYRRNERIGRVGVLALPSRQFLFVRAEVSVEGGSAPRKGDFSVRASDDTYRAWTEYRGFRGYWVDGLDLPYDVGDPGGWLGFDLPAPFPGDPTVVLDRPDGSVRWSLPSGAVDSLRSPPPRWAVRSVEVPDRVGPEESVTVSVTAHNAGNGDGVFRFTVYPVAPNDNFLTREFPVPAGETRTRGTTIDAFSGGRQPGSTVSVTVDTPTETYRPEIRVTEATTTGEE